MLFLVWTRFRSIFTVLVYVFFLFGFSACQKIFFFPSSDIVWRPSESGFNFISHKIAVSDSENISIWEVLPKGKIKGTILYLHGNAENLSTHSQSMMWLVVEGYRIVALDYRGFGESLGVATVEGASDDILKSLDWTISRIPKDEKLIIFAQSIGASLTAYALSNADKIERINLLVLDSGFSSYDKIAKEKLEQMGLFSPISSLISLCATNCCDPSESLSKLKLAKVLFVHNEDDEVTNYKNSIELYNVFIGNKLLWTDKSGGHAAYFRTRENRGKFLELLNSLD